MDKVKVSSEMAKAIEGALDEYGSDPNQVLENHRYDWISECVPLNSLNHLELAEILLKGYEVEQKPEELLREKIIHLRFNCVAAPISSSVYKKSQAEMNGIIFALNTLNIKIEGVNA